MTSREKILAAVKAAQPEPVTLPDLSTVSNGSPSGDPVEKFINILQAIGGHAKLVHSYTEIAEALKYQFADARRVVSTIPELSGIAEVYCDTDQINDAENIDLVVLTAHFGVAENGAVHITEAIMCDRALPFICQHLAVVVPAENIVANMHDAYRRIADADYGFGIFIAGPSKTADIEQSLVLGAHGPLSMTVFLLQS